MCEEKIFRSAERPSGCYFEILWQHLGTTRRNRHILASLIQLLWGRQETHTRGALSKPVCNSLLEGQKEGGETMERVRGERCSFCVSPLQNYFKLLWTCLLFNLHFCKFLKLSLLMCLAFNQATWEIHTLSVLICLPCFDWVSSFFYFSWT